MGYCNMRQVKYIIELPKENGNSTSLPHITEVPLLSLLSAKIWEFAEILVLRTSKKSIKREWCEIKMIERWLVE